MLSFNSPKPIRGLNALSVRRTPAWAGGAATCGAATATTRGSGCVTSMAERRDGDHARIQIHMPPALVASEARRYQGPRGRRAWRR